MEDIELRLLNAQLRNSSELLWAQIFNSTIAGCEWMTPPVSLSPGRSAVGYPYLYVLFRILNEIKPVHILETGLGQSTKLIGTYIKYMETCNKPCSHMIVEHDPEWIKFFEGMFQLTDSSHIVQLDITKSRINAGGNIGETEVTEYVGFVDALRGQKFDLISIDGPFGYEAKDYSRIDIMGLLPGCLNEDFVLIFDDYERVGEQNTVKLVELILKENGIRFKKGIYSGCKDLCMLVSESLGFLCSM